jgi:hypothetical protein
MPYFRKRSVDRHAAAQLEEENGRVIAGVIGSGFVCTAGAKLNDCLCLRVAGVKIMARALRWVLNNESAEIVQMPPAESH